MINKTNALIGITIFFIATMFLFRNNPGNMDLSNKNMKDFEVSPNILIIFSGFLLNHLREQANLEMVEWLMPFHPYAAPEQIYRGKFQDISITVLIPPMGASPISLPPVRMNPCKPHCFA